MEIFHKAHNSSGDWTGGGVAAKAKDRPPPMLLEYYFHTPYIWHIKTETSSLLVLLLFFTPMMTIELFLNFKTNCICHVIQLVCLQFLPYLLLWFHYLKSILINDIWQKSDGKETYFEEHNCNLHKINFSQVVITIKCQVTKASYFHVFVSLTLCTLKRFKYIIHL